MADELMDKEPSLQSPPHAAADNVITARQDSGVLSARGEKLLALLAALALIAAAWFAYRAFYYQEEGDPVASAMLAFERQNSLVVFSSRFEVVAESIHSRSIAGVELEMLESRQAAIIPALVEYRLDLSAMDESTMDWDGDSQTLTVTLPQIQTSRPNLDEAKARIFTEGVWVTNDASKELAANNSQQAEQRALAFAKNPEVLSLARNAARDAVRQNLSVPLQMAGYEQARVEVRFADDTP